MFEIDGVELEFTNDALVAVAKKAIELLDSFYDFNVNLPIRTITVNVFKLSHSGDYVQFSFLNDDTQKSEKLNRSIDKLREKFGYGVLQRALNVDSVYVCNSKEMDDDFVPFDKR